MITIQGFAKLCGCNTQTLRYYDRIGLLTPAKVDEWTGYRYYEEEQAMLFIKIKNLQQADFSIEEIRPLLSEDDARLMAALDRKIEEQKQKLERIREIQRSYLQERMDMQKMVNTITGFLEGRMDDPMLWQEFGLDSTRETEITAKAHELMTEWLTEVRNASGQMAQCAGNPDLEAMREVMDALVNGKMDEKQNLLMAIAPNDADPEEGLPEDAEKVFECSGWEHVSECIGNLPDLGDGKQNFFLFRVREGSLVNDPGFSTLMLAVMDAKYNAMKGGMTCKVGRSSDGLNHFALFRK